MQRQRPKQRQRLRSGSAWKWWAIRDRTRRRNACTCPLRLPRRCGAARLPDGTCTAPGDRRERRAGCTCPPRPGCTCDRSCCSRHTCSRARARTCARNESSDLRRRSGTGSMHRCPHDRCTAGWDRRSRRPPGCDAPERCPPLRPPRGCRGRPHPLGRCPEPRPRSPSPARDAPRPPLSRRSGRRPPVARPAPRHARPRGIRSRSTAGALPARCRSKPSRVAHTLM